MLIKKSQEERNMFDGFYQQVHPEIARRMPLLGQLKISPVVLEAIAGSVRLQPVLGLRLSELLLAEDKATLQEVYQRLGQHGGYLSREGIVHGDLHVDNVIVDGNQPVIIDWAQARMLKIPKMLSTDPGVLYGLWMEQNAEQLLCSTADRVRFREGLYSLLKSKYEVGFHKRFFEI